MRDARRHLTHGGEPFLAMPFRLALLDQREVLEGHQLARAMTAPREQRCDGRAEFDHAAVGTGERALHARREARGALLARRERQHVLQRHPEHVFGPVPDDRLGRAIEQHDLVVRVCDDESAGHAVDDAVTQRGEIGQARRGTYEVGARARE